MKKKYAKGMAVLTFLMPIISYAQIGHYKKYADISPSDFYEFFIEQDISYGVGKTDFKKLDESGSYQTISQVELELDLFVPNTALSEGKRAVIIMVPGSGRGGCRDGLRYLQDGGVDSVNGCDQKTLLQGSNVIQEGRNYNHLNNPIASQYAQRGFIVASVNTRYNYQHTVFAKNGSNRWFKSVDGTDDNTNPVPLLNLASAHLEYMVVDLKRVMRWLTVNADTYDIDPNYVFIIGASGASKMASLAALSNQQQLIVDDPADIDVDFETTYNNWSVRNSTPGIKGVIMRKGDTNGTSNLKLMDTMSANTDSFMFWAGTADKSILQGMSEAIEEKCEILQTCSTQLFSLPNKTHTSVSTGFYPHTKSGDQKSAMHSYDFMVNAILKDSKELPLISISQNSVSFDESVGSAQVEIIRLGETSDEISFTVSADQMREVTLENGSSGTFDLITRHVAKSSNSDGLVMYNESTGYAYEDAFGGDLRKTSDKVMTHTSGKGKGEFTEISSADNQYHNMDFVGDTQVLTMAAGQTSIIFNVAINSDDLVEDNECFNVRILNAYGATIGNSVETITIKDDDNMEPETSDACSNADYNEPFDSGSENDSPSDTPVNVGLSTPAMSVTEGDNLVLTLKADDVVKRDIEIEYQTFSNTFTASTSDYKWTKEIAVIQQGSDSVDVSIQTTDDAMIESDELFMVKLNRIVQGDALLSPENSSSEVTIIDNEDQLPKLTIKEYNYVGEGSGSINVRVSVDTPLDKDTVITYRTWGGNASSKSDFNGVTSAQKILPAHKHSVFINIGITNDDVLERHEYFKVKILGLDNSNLELTNSVGFITIVDDD